jgi:hypothetical protein
MPIFDHFDFLAPIYETFIPPKDPQEMWKIADLPASGALLDAGGVPWARLNDLTPNQTYEAANPPAMLPESQSRSLPQLTLKYLKKMFALQ